MRELIIHVTRLTSSLENGKKGIMKPIPIGVEQLPAKLQAGVRKYLNRHPRVSALETELRFALDGSHWVVGATTTGGRAFGRTPLAALKRFANVFLLRTF